MSSKKPKKEEAPAGRSAGGFVRKSSGVLFDQQTSFEWFVLPQRKNYDAYMLDPTVLPGEGWKEPSRDDLKTLVTKDRNADGHFLDPVFEGLLQQTDLVWTSESVNNKGTVWAFDFSRGKPIEDWTIPTRHNAVFYVRKNT